MLKGIQNGDENAIQSAIGRYSRLMWHIAAVVLKNAASPEDVEECVADVFVYLWQNAEKYDETRGSLKSWLSLVAKSKAIDRYRQLSRSRPVSLDESIGLDFMSVTDELLSAEVRRELYTAVQALGEPDREIMIRRHYYWQKPREIAFALDLPVKQIENHLYRSRLKLRAMLSQD